MRGGKLGLVQDCRRLCIIAGDDCVLLPTMFVQYNPVIDTPNQCTCRVDRGEQMMVIVFNRPKWCLMPRRGISHGQYG
jgi:hypothetical protein